MTEPCDTNLVVKTQWIRLWDVFGLGPMMIVVGLATRSRRPVLGPAVAFFGVTTMAYNAYNYWKVRQALQRGELNR